MERLGRQRLSSACLAVGVVALVVYLLSPRDSPVQLVAWFVPMVTAIWVTGARCRRATGEGKLPLRILFGAVLAYVLLLAAWYLGPVVFGLELPFPSVLDLGFFIDYAVFAFLLVLVLRLGPIGREVEARVAVIDALILTTALCAILWVGVVVPSLHAEASTPATVVALLYPAFNLVLCGLGVRLVLDRLSQSGLAGFLLLGWLAAQVAGDVVYGIQSAAETFEYGSPVFVTWMIAYSCLAAMVAHPSASSLLGQQDAVAESTGAPSGRSGVRRARLVLLYLAAVVPLVMAAFSNTRSNVLLALAAGGFALVIWRLALLAGDLREQQRLADELELKGHELLQANDDLRDAGEARSVFLATMSHEIRTPLN
ncbi:MAG: Diguanylate cyclase, partial [Nocardioides sp.]|uniref:hypothetical protein n=1 Tax=Nocardioides sp. TaxID=35761 RepID=UPI00261F79F8